MNFCHLNLCCNELPFLKEKLPFLYTHFQQIIIIDYDILNKCNSKDGSIEYIENFPDPNNKITLLKDFNPDKITNYNGVSIIEKQKMFSYGSQLIKDDIDVVWATDLDEFFDETLINNVKKLYSKDHHLISIDIPHIVFVYNQFNLFNYGSRMYIKPRITKHKKGKIYGHCNFETYGKTIKLTNDFLYHFAYVGYNRCLEKLNLYNKKGTIHPHTKKYLECYKTSLLKKEKYINISHPNGTKIESIKYNNDYPVYINMNRLITNLNKL
jgi:hypothetical protein